MEVRLDKYGCIAVPKSARDRLGIGPGTELVVEVAEGRLILRPVHERTVLEEREGLLVSTAEVAPDMDVPSIVEETRATRVRTLAGRDRDR